MSGTGAAAGWSFQAAVSVQEALSILNQSKDLSLQVEGDVDGVDWAVSDGGVLLRVGQAKIKANPKSWGPTDLAVIVKGLTAEVAGEYVFQTNATLSRDGDKLWKAIVAAGNGSVTPAQQAKLKDAGLDTLPPGEMAKLTLDARRPDDEALLEIAAFHLIRLFERANQTLSTGAACTTAEVLYAKMLLKAGKVAKVDRTFSKADLEKIVGLPAGGAPPPNVILRHELNASYLYATGGTVSVFVEAVNQGAKGLKRASLVVRTIEWTPEHGDPRPVEQINQPLKWLPAGYLGALHHGNVSDLPAQNDEAPLPSEQAGLVRPLMVALGKQGKAELLLATAGKTKRIASEPGRLTMTLQLNGSGDKISEHLLVLDWNGEHTNVGGFDALPRVAVA